MASFEGVLASIPGYGGYLAKRQYNQEQDANSLRQITGVLSLQTALQQQQQAAQMQPLQLEALKQQVAQGGVAAADAARKAAFYSPENRAHFMTPGVLSAPATPNDDNGNPNPSVQADPQFDFSKFLQSAAQQGVVNPETYANHLAQRDLAKATQESTAQARRDALTTRLFDIETRSQDRTMADQTRRDLAAEANATRRELAALVASGRDTPVAVQGVDAAGNQTVNFARPSQGPQVFNTRPVSTANADVRIDNSRAAQIQRQYTTASNPTFESLNQLSLYKQFRNEGDFAQAATMAAEALRRAARSGSQRFKGDAGSLLGSGYGSGNLADRLENYISQEFSKGGGPTKETLAKVDRLVGAAEAANFDNLANTTKRFAGQAQGQNLSLRNAIGVPFVSGTHVVFPDGVHANFSDSQTAQARAQQWLESNK